MQDDHDDHGIKKIFWTILILGILFVFSSGLVCARIVTKLMNLQICEISWVRPEYPFGSGFVFQQMITIGLLQKRPISNGKPVR